MKIKNFKINLEAIKSKFLKLKRFVLAGSLAATLLTGCGEKTKSSIFDGTLLEGASVITFCDGSKDVATTFGSCSNNYYDSGSSLHYRSIITGEEYSDEKCGLRSLIHYQIANVSNISSYLTQDELTKSINGDLSEEDIIAIISRVVEPTTELGETTETSLEKTIN